MILLPQNSFTYILINKLFINTFYTYKETLMQLSHLCILITSFASTTAYGAAAWIELVQKAPTREATQFLTAKNAINHNNPTLFMNTLIDNSSLVHYVHKSSISPTQPATQSQHEDLLKTAIGTLRSDRFFFVTQLLDHHGATISSMHIAHCIAALHMRREQFSRAFDYFCIEYCVLTNLQKFYYSMGDRILADTKIPAQRSLQLAVHDFIDTHGSTIGNITELLAAVGIHPAASSHPTSSSSGR